MSSVSEGRTVPVAFGSWPARLYLAVCAGLIVWLAVVSSQPQEDGSFAAVVPLLFTAPTSMLALALPDGATAGLYAVLSASAVVNAWLLDVFYRRLRSRRG